MAALDAPRNTEAMGPVGQRLSMPVAADAVIQAGALVALKAGYAAQGDDADNTSIVVGRAAESKDATDLDDGDLSVDVEEGVFCWDNSGTDALDQDDVGKTCYIEDDHTVCETGDNKTAAGKFLGFNGTQCMVETFIGVAANGATVP